jgi:hypothetical protein
VPAEFSAKHVGKELVADHRDLAPVHAQAPLGAQKSERQRFEGVWEALDVELCG